jgi:hypothetical protein
MVCLIKNAPKGFVLGVITPLAWGGWIGESAGAERNTIMKKHKKTPWVEPGPRIHISRDDRARTNAGKTMNSKVRSEGRTLAEQERNALVARMLAAEETKQLPTCE